MSFERQFEGAGVLDGLLDLAGSAHDSNEVLARFVAGHQEGATASAIIPTLFDEEPRFPDAEIARRLYQNLLGLWDLVASGRTVELNPTERKKREKPPKPVPPPPYGSDGPDGAFVEAAWRYLEALPAGDPRTLERLTHAFENRQDDLVQWLDEAELDEDSYTTVRYLLFELFAMLELGGASAVRSVRRPELQRAPGDGGGVPPALRRYADEALEESDLGESEPLRARVYQGLSALWAARTSS